MGKKKSDKISFKKKLFRKYRFVILDEDTFQELLALKLTRLNILVVSAIFSIILIVSTVLLISFTSLREYIPGHSSSELKKQALELDFKVDSLIRAVEFNDAYMNSIKLALNGEDNVANLNLDSTLTPVVEGIERVGLAPSKEDSLLREKVDNEDRYNLFETAKTTTNFVLSSPVSGDISQDYNLQNGHFAIDIVVPQNTPVKAVADGRVLFASWTSDTGFVIIIDHGNELLSVYKHNTSLTKIQGDLVEAREVVAISGASGELSTGPHLHFELWKDGYPVNPNIFIDF